MAKLNYMQQVKVIQKELDCSFADAKVEYKKRKVASEKKAKADAKKAEAKAKKEAEASKDGGEKKIDTPKTSSAKSKGKGANPSRAKELEIVFNRQGYSANRMAEIAKEYLGDDAKMHRNVNTPRECYFTCGDVRVPENGVCIIKL